MMSVEHHIKWAILEATRQHRRYKATLAAMSLKPTARERAILFGRRVELEAAERDLERWLEVAREQAQRTAPANG